MAEEDCNSLVVGTSIPSSYYLCIHGCLHALGFDHGDRVKRKTEMETLERRILADMGLDTSALELIASLWFKCPAKINLGLEVLRRRKDAIP